MAFAARLEQLRSDITAQGERVLGCCSLATECYFEHDQAKSSAVIAADDAIDKADATSDMKKRHEFLQEATRIAAEDIPMIPVHYEQDIYAAKKSVTVVPRMDKFIWAYEMDVA